MGEQYVPQQNEAPSPVLPRELYRGRVGFSDYVITDEEREVIEEWASQIQELRDLIDSGDKDGLAELAKRENSRLYIGKFLEKLETEGLDEEDKTLLSIGLWIQREQDKWRKWGVIIKVLKGGTFNLSSFLENKGKSSCLDSSILVKRMAEHFHIAGQVELTNQKNPFSHRYFQSQSGKVVDVWWGWRRGGLFQNNEEFKKKKKMAKHLCGMAS